MYKLKCWYKDNGTPTRYIISADSISELWELFTMEIDLLDVLDLSIYKEI